MHTLDSITLPSSGSLLKKRLWFYSVAFTHLMITAVVTLSIDMSDDQDPEVSAYINIRWKLITCWFNMITLFYFPICIYCDWKELCCQWKSPHVARLRLIKDVMMTSILFPVTLLKKTFPRLCTYIAPDNIRTSDPDEQFIFKRLEGFKTKFADFIFWRIWHKDLTLIAPPKTFAYLPIWAQHSLHTVSMVVMILDLLLVPRKRPRNLRPGAYIILSFLATYMLMCGISFLRGEIVYTLFIIFDGFKLSLLTLMVIVECLFFYFIQWCIVDLFWGENDIRAGKIM